MPNRFGFHAELAIATAVLVAGPVSASATERSEATGSPGVDGDGTSETVPALAAALQNDGSTAASGPSAGIYADKGFRIDRKAQADFDRKARAHAAKINAELAQYAAVRRDPPSRIRKLGIVAQTQKTGYWCAPASARAMISRYRSKSKLPSQKTLAKKMRTGKRGTSLRYVAGAVNAYTAKKKRFNWYDHRNQNDYYWGLGYDLDRGHTLMGTLQWGGTPWRYNRNGAAGHAAVIRGYSSVYRRDSYTVHWWDPWRNTGYKNGSKYRSWYWQAVYGQNVLGANGAVSLG
ncbi:C39 family peptidase [Actinomadura fulvescens]|uniref:Peptidase C39-like domain-containing protein n=1 Tax=Actinomadura fulvescens TaxID=46160 RepID=A0ABN3QNN8_9ACTN